MALKSGSRVKPRQMRTGKATAIDLFAGCGGLTQGLKQAGFRVLGAIDVDSLAAESYQENHPEVEFIQCDIAKVDVLNFRKKLSLRKGQLDLLAGCPPCQGFSTLKTLNGSRGDDDKRNDLVFQFIRFVEEFRPKAIMMENVPGLAQNKRIRRIESALKQLGYLCDKKIIDAADYGVPQRRKRMILLAGKRRRIDFPEEEPIQFTVFDAIGNMPVPGNTNDPLHDFPEARSKQINALIRRIPKDGGSRRDLGRASQLPCHQKCDGFKDIYGRMAWGKVAPTITGGCTNPSKGRFLHPEQHRAITLREAAILQSFPQDYKFSLRRGKGSAATLIGNALPPELIWRQACKVLEFLKR